MATLPCSPRKNEWTPVEECKEFDCPERNTSFIFKQETIEHFHEGVPYAKRLNSRIEVFAAVPNPAPQKTDTFGTDEGGGTSSANSYSVFHNSYVLPNASAKASTIFNKVFLEFNRWSVLLMKQGRK